MPENKSNEKMHKIWERFVNSGEVGESLAPEIAESWKRSRTYGVDPFGESPPVDEQILNNLRKKKSDAS